MSEITGRWDSAHEGRGVFRSVVRRWHQNMSRDGMIKVALIGLSVILIVGIVAYSWLNRASDRVILTLVTAMTLGAVGFITKELVTNKVQRAKEEITVVTFFGLPNYQVLNISLPYHHDLARCLQGVKEEDLPDNQGGVVDIGFGQDLHYDALQYSILTTMFTRFNQGWNVRSRETITPAGRSISWQAGSERGKTVKLHDVLGALEENYFVRNERVPEVPEMFGGKAVIPEGTRLEVKQDEKGRSFSLMLENRLISVVISFSKAGGSVGIGKYSKLLGIGGWVTDLRDENTRSMGTATYNLTIEIVQNVWLNGHPDMEMYREWADSIMKLLSTTYGYTEIREQHMESYKLFGRSGVMEHPGIVDSHRFEE